MRITALIGHEECPEIIYDFIITDLKTYLIKKLSSKRAFIELI